MRVSYHQATSRPPRASELQAPQNAPQPATGTHLVSYTHWLRSTQQITYCFGYCQVLWRPRVCVCANPCSVSRCNGRPHQQILFFRPERAAGTRTRERSSSPARQCAKRTVAKGRLANRSWLARIGSRKWLVGRIAQAGDTPRRAADATDAGAQPHAAETRRFKAGPMRSWR